MQQQNLSFKMKIFFLGRNSGKMSLLDSFIDNQFRQNGHSGNGVDFRRQRIIIGEYSVLFFLWNVQTRSNLKLLPSSFFHQSKIFCFCFSLNSHQDFLSLQRWVKEVKAKTQAQKKKLFLIGCKCDLQHEIEQQTILLFAQEYGLQYFQTSAKTGEGVQAAMNKILLQAYQHELQQTPGKQMRKVVVEQNKNKNCSII